jgi:hypothetical protein
VPLPGTLGVLDFTDPLDLIPLRHFDFLTFVGGLDN